MKRRKSTWLVEHLTLKRRGLRSGVTLIEQVYGKSEDGWFGSGELDYLPAQTAPAWQPWLPPGTNIVRLSAYQKLIVAGERERNSTHQNEREPICEPSKNQPEMTRQNETERKATSL
jgi:hypothetical protein